MCVLGFVTGRYLCPAHDWNPLAQYSPTEIFTLEDDSDAESMIGLHNAIWAELLEDRAPSSVEEYRARHRRSNMDNRHFVVRSNDDGDVVGLLITV